MDKMTEYRNHVKQLLHEYERLYNLQPTEGVDSFVIFDEERDHYFLMSLGWLPDRRVFQTVLYVRLRNDKIYVEEDWTEEGIATGLVKKSVPREDIVLAFHPPLMRQFSEFAVA